MLVVLVAALLVLTAARFGVRQDAIQRVKDVLVHVQVIVPDVDLLVVITVQFGVIQLALQHVQMTVLVAVQVVLTLAAEFVVSDAEKYVFQIALMDV